MLRPKSWWWPSSIVANVIFLAWLAFGFTLKAYGGSVVEGCVFVLLWYVIAIAIRFVFIQSRIALAR